VTHWKNVVLTRNATLKDSIRCIDASALQVALVLGPGSELVGMLTDGDVRRALLRGIGMDATVEKAMNANPMTAPVGSLPDWLRGEMRRNSIRHLPLLDSTGRVVDLATLNDLTGMTRRDNWIVLMAGGLGSRLSPLTDNCPKPMLKIGDKPLLETILEKFIEDGFYRFFISVNYLAEVVKSHFGDGSRWHVEIVYLHETERLGTAGALSLLPGTPEQPLLVMNGDVLTKVNFHQLLDFHESHAAAATMCVREYEFQVPYGVVTTDAHRIVSIDEKPVQQFFVNAGIYAIAPEMLSRIPAKQFFDMPTLFSEAINAGQETAVFPLREYWMDIGHVADLHRANGEYREFFA
jgi:dTDP-glucose pyrophosphorylase